MRNMKDSGIEWIGEIPEDWSITKYGRCVRRIKEYDDNPNKTVLSLTIKGVKVKDLSDNMGKLASDYTGHQIVRKGNLVVTPRDFDCTPILSGIAPCDGCISNLYFILESNGKIYLPYINHQMWGVKYGGDIWKRLSYGMRYSYNYEQFSNIALAIPQFYEQQIIADYLDNKVKDIDNIILKTKETIEEYKKYKQSVITEAVTKGLNPNVEMKDSGIQWVGEIPKHWNICKIKYLFECLDSLRKPISAELRENTLGLYDYYGASGVIDKIDDYNVDDEVLLVGEDGANLITRNLPLVYKAKGKFWVNNHAHILKLNKNNSYNYYAFLLEAGDYTLDISGSAQPKLTQDKLINFKILQLPVQEQINIANFLEKKCSEINNLISKKQNLITELEQYKKSLIYECVTGKKEVSVSYAY